MPKNKLVLPERFSFATEIPVRITDINYGGHVGNDSILSLIHEARVRYLHYHGYTELNLAGVGLIMSDVTIEFKAEIFYDEMLEASVAAAEFSRVAFELYYKLAKKTGDQWVSVAFARTAMVCFDYATKKIVSVPADVVSRLME